MKDDIAKKENPGMTYIHTIPTAHKEDKKNKNGYTGLSVKDVLSHKRFYNISQQTFMFTSIAKVVHNDDNFYCFLLGTAVTPC